MSVGLVGAGAAGEEGGGAFAGAVAGAVVGAVEAVSGVVLGALVVGMGTYKNGKARMLRARWSDGVGADLGGLEAEAAWRAFRRRRARRSGRLVADALDDRVEAFRVGNTRA